MINTEIIIIQHDLFQVTGFSKLENIKVVKLDFYSKANMKERDELKDKVRKLLKKQDSDNFILIIVFCLEARIVTNYSLNNCTNFKSQR